MRETTANAFRQNLKSTIDLCVENHEVIKVKRRNGENFIVMGESDWNAIEETLYLNQVPGLVERIQKADKEPLEAGTPLEELDW